MQTDETVRKVMPWKSNISSKSWMKRGRMLLWKIQQQRRKKKKSPTCMRLDVSNLKQWKMNPCKHFSHLPHACLACEILPEWNHYGTTCACNPLTWWHETDLLSSGFPPMFTWQSELGKKGNCGLILQAIGLEKKQLYQQWNSSLIGMRRRDEAHSAMQEAL